MKDRLFSNEICQRMLLIFAMGIIGLNSACSSVVANSSENICGTVKEGKYLVLSAEDVEWLILSRFYQGQLSLVPECPSTIKIYRNPFDQDPIFIRSASLTDGKRGLVADLFQVLELKLDNK